VNEGLQIRSQHFLSPPFLSFIIADALKGPLSRFHEPPLGTHRIVVGNFHP